MNAGGDADGVIAPYHNLAAPLVQLEEIGRGWLLLDDELPGCAGVYAFQQSLNGRC